MSREWKPGDVAMVTTRSGIEYRAAYALAPGIDYFWKPLTPTEKEFGDHDMSARPLLVLDPESDEDAHRVIRAFWAHGTDDCDDDQAMRDALRSLVAPPKPEVYQHFVERSAGWRDGSQIARSLCGKVWSTREGGVVIGKCSECEELADDTGWMA